MVFLIEFTVFIMDCILVYCASKKITPPNYSRLLAVKDFLAALGNYPKAIRLHGRLFEECFQLIKTSAL